MPVPVGKLYMASASPAVRAVLLLEKALGIELEHIEVDILQGDQFRPDYLELNPQHTVPFYIDEDGTKIWDSHAIMAYLVGKYAKDDLLYPRDLAKRAVVDQRLHFDSGNVFFFVRQIVLGLIQGAITEITPDQNAGVMAAYDFLDKFLAGEKWMCGALISIADLSLISTVSTLQVFAPVDERKFKNLISWIKRCRGLPYYQVNENGVQQFRAFIQPFLNKKQ